MDEVPAGYFCIKSVATDRVLDILGEKDHDDAPIVLWTCQGEIACRKCVGDSSLHSLITSNSPVSSTPRSTERQPGDYYFAAC